MTQPPNDHTPLSLPEVANAAPRLFRLREQQRRAKLHARVAELRLNKANPALEHTEV